MPSLAENKSHMEDDDSFFLIEPWFMCITVILLLLIIVGMVVKMILDRSGDMSYMGNLANAEVSPIKKLVNPRIVILVCSVLIFIMVTMNLIVSLVTDDDDDHSD